MKKILFPILATVLIAFAIVPLTAGTVFADSQQVTIDEIKYTLDDTYHTAVVSGYTTSLPVDIVIPPKVTSGKADYTVTGIGNTAFQSKTNLKTVTFEQNSELKTIGQNAFDCCYSLEAITIPAGVTSIGNAAFQNNTNLKTVTFEQNSELKTIGENAFNNCGNLETITIPAGVTSIGNAAFQTNAKLKTVTFEENSELETIGEKAFNNCGNLETITIPAGVTSIGKNAFNECKRLTAITIPKSVTSLGEGAFDGSGLASVTFETGISLGTIGQAAFENCESLETITIPAGVTSIGNKAFNGCKSLTAITIPKSVTSLGESAFDGSGLASVTFETGSSLETIGQKVFNKCEKLTAVTIPASVTSLGESAFANSGLASVTFETGSSLETIGHSAFRTCSNLQTITIPASVTSLGEQAFENSDGLQSITFEPGSRLNTIGAEAFCFTGLKLIHYLGDESAWEGVTKGNLWARNPAPAVHCVPNKTTKQKATPDADGSIDRYLCDEPGCGDWGYGGTVIPRLDQFTLSETSYTYDGTVKTPTVTVKDAAGQTIEASNYSVTIKNRAGEEVTEPVEVDTYNVNVVMQGDKYEGTKVLVYTIDPKAVTPTVKVSNKVYTGKALKPVVTVRAGTVTFKNGTDYTVGYSNNTKVGKASAKVTMKGNYKGSKTATFKILPKKAGISKAVPGKKLVKVTMSTKVSATGGTVYQIQYRIKGAAKWKTTTTKNKTKTIKKLKKGKQYQIKVRAYKPVGGSKYYGAWSKVKTTKKIK